MKKSQENPKSDIEKLTMERNNILMSGYSEDDPLILHLDKQLRILLAESQVVGYRIQVVGCRSQFKILLNI